MTREILENLELLTAGDGLAREGHKTGQEFSGRSCRECRQPNSSSDPRVAHPPCGTLHLPRRVPGLAAFPDRFPQKFLFQFLRPAVASGRSSGPPPCHSLPSLPPLRSSPVSAVLPDPAAGAIAFVGVR